MREIGSLLRANVEAGTPFGDGSGNGQKLVDLVNEHFVDDQVALTTSVSQAGCTS